MTTIPFGLNLAALQLQNFLNPVGLRSRSIGSIIADITIEERHLDTLAITDHPIERDAVVSDHAFMQPFEVVIRAGWSNSSFQAGADPTYVQTIYFLLLALQESREPFEILTGKRAYQNMLIHRLLTETTEATENSLIVVAECRQVIIVGTQVVQFPGNAVQANPGLTGNTTNVGSASPFQTFGGVGATDLPAGSFNVQGAQQSLPEFNFGTP